MVPNVAGVIANSPVLANIFVPLFAGVHSGTFTEAEIQTLLLTNAVTNACAWAVAFHSYLALKAGLDPADVQAIRERRAPQEPRIAALSAYARALIEKRGHVGDAAVEAFLSAGFKPTRRWRRWRSAPPPQSPTMRSPSPSRRSSRCSKSTRGAP